MSASLVGSEMCIRDSCANTAVFIANTKVPCFDRRPVVLKVTQCGLVAVHVPEVSDVLEFHRLAGSVLLYRLFAVT
eukprot:4936245-Alexandrium_andersonii.AAC.1